MSEEEGGSAPAPKKAINLQMILVLANTLLVFGALGVMVYTKLIYERPPIVEEVEIKKQIEEVRKPVIPAEHAIVAFDQMSVNIAMTAGKAHYATVAFAVECKDPETAAIVKAKKAQFTDQVIAALGRRQMSELNTIQGKLLLKTELMREFAKIAPDGGITDFYFSNFMLQ